MIKSYSLERMETKLNKKTVLMNEIKPKIKAFIFDMDGTIINTESAWQNVTKHVLKMYRGIEKLTEEQQKFLYSLSGLGLENAASEVKRYFDLKQSIDEIVTQKTQAVDLYFNDVNFIEGFEQFHKRLQEHAFPTSIATNADPVTLRKLSQQMNFKHFFGNNLYCSADVGNKAKPDPAVFLHAARQLGVAPHECVVFEDSIAGFKAAQAAGIKCIAIKSETNQHCIDLAQQSIANYHEAEEALKKI
jgi:HAD superfamily hydrolase (TIGR01509 family)